MSIAEGYKRIYADDLAQGLGFEWDYESAEDHDLYEALEGMGYHWNGKSWLAPEYTPEQKLKKTRRRRKTKAQMEEQLLAWKNGEPIR